MLKSSFLFSRKALTVAMAGAEYNGLEAEAEAEAEAESESGQG